VQQRRRRNYAVGEIRNRFTRHFHHFHRNPFVERAAPQKAASSRIARRKSASALLGMRPFSIRYTISTIVIAETPTCSPFRRRFVDKGRSPASQTRIRKKIPDRRVRISNRGDHHKPDRGKSANISVRFWAISSAEGAGPYFASKPRREWIGSRTGALPACFEEVSIFGIAAAATRLALHT